MQSTFGWWATQVVNALNQLQICGAPSMNRLFDSWVGDHDPRYSRFRDSMHLDRIPIGLLPSVTGPPARCPVKTHDQVGSARGSCAPFLAVFYSDESALR
jgi:hypothetical protein